MLATRLKPSRSATRKVFLSLLALPLGSQQLDTNRPFWSLLLIPLCLLLAAHHPCWSLGLTSGEKWEVAGLTVSVIVCSLWKEDVWRSERPHSGC